MPQTTFIHRPAISAQIVPRLRQDIIEGHWKPGQRLPEPLLCEQFGVSRTPLRDAFRILESEGLLELVINVGAVVTRPDLAHLEATFDAIALLEAGAAEQVARTRPSQCLASLRSMIGSMTEADRLSDPRRYFDSNDSFHRAIVLGAGNPVLATVHENLMMQVNRLRYSYYRRQLVPARTGKGHDEILGLLESGAPEQAFAAMREHVRDVARRMLSLASTLDGFNRP
jgi:DNA-binding GntR family transcriptional regulator